MPIKSTSARASCRYRLAPRRSKGAPDAATSAAHSHGLIPTAVLSATCWSIPRVVPYLHEILGTGFRLDHNLGIITMRKGAEGHLLHGSSGPGFDRHQYYIFKDGKMHNGLTVAAYQLADVNAGDGGLCLIPGSHKGNYPCPMALRRGEAYREFIKQITCNAGDCVLFTEATTHGTLPWTADHDRRTALFRFSPGNLAYVAHNWSAAMLALMTDEQRKVLEPPYHARLDRPVLEV